MPALRRQSVFGTDTFFLLNRFGSLSEFGWDGPEVAKLWRYSQHYFDDLNALDASKRVKSHLGLLKSWLAENQPGKGTGWEPYPTSLRIVNWIKWHLAGGELPDECVQSLAVQVRWLRRRLEKHLLGNHLFVNAKALVFCGFFFEGDEAQSWLDLGLKIIEREFSEQVLSDGGNFERSPMYHAIFLEDVLDLVNLSRAYSESYSTNQFESWDKKISQMLRFLQRMCHPDGEISHFNDSAIGMAGKPEELVSYASRLGFVQSPNDCEAGPLSCWHSADSGYVRVESPNAVAILDVAPIGPDYLPGHAHADTLSFELSVFGQRCLVNGGTSEYGTGPIRLHERGTASHNTVEVDGENSSEIWSGFRVARRAYPVGLEIVKSYTSTLVRCAHDGYKRLRGSPFHSREWSFFQEKLVVNDSVSGKSHKAVARFHIHPDIRLVKESDDAFKLDLDLGIVRINVLGGKACIEQSYYAPVFGNRLNTCCLAVHLVNGNSSCVEISWETKH